MSHAVYPHVFSPLKFGRLTLKNRLAFTSTVTLFGEKGRVTDRMVEFHRERARGGVGMIITEGMVVQPQSILHPNVITPFAPESLEGLQRLADAVEGEDCRLFGQLWHIGRQNLLNPVDASVGVSDQPDALSWVVPHVLDRGEIAAVVDAFIQSAKNLSRAGFSGAELHGAHGYLITQFLSPWSNTRADEYGGDLEGRLRFLREIIAGIRAACGPNFMLGLKMPADEGVKGGIDCDEAERILMALAGEDGLDYVAFSQGNFSPSLADHVPDMHYPPGPFLHLHARLRKRAGGLPVMALGRIVDLKHAESVIAGGTADLIGLSRALLSDAALPAKTRRGEEQQVRPCIYCNVCWGEAALGKPIACIHNPHLGTAGESTWRPALTGRRKRVTVIGGGVAGLEAAWVAAARGHRVTLLGTSPVVGGKAVLEARLPGRAEVGKVYAFQLARLREHAVELQLGHRVGVTEVEATHPDAIVAATGSHMRRLWMLAPDSEQGLDLRAYIATSEQDAPRADGTAILYDHDHTPATYAAADLLAARYRRLIVVTPRTQLARAVPLASAFNVFRRLYLADVEIIYAHVPVAIAAGTVRLMNPINGRERNISDVALFVYATPRQADDALGRALQARGFDVRLVGDCRAPRSMIAAVHEGHAAGEAV